MARAITNLTLFVCLMLGLLVIVPVALPVDAPNQHVIDKHSEAVQLFNRKDDWCQYDSPSMRQWLFCERDPERAGKADKIGGVLVGYGAAGAFVITAFYAAAKYWRRVIARDEYRRIK